MDSKTLNRIRTALDQRIKHDRELPKRSVARTIYHDMENEVGEPYHKYLKRENSSLSYHLRKMDYQGFDLMGPFCHQI
ncbi:hypothetical protein P8881_00360 [Bacillus haynesii]|nr:hypothetical protein [Bacillus haynesii]MEC0736026.1 hypothetical protein [Bacillus haynesii]